MTILLLASLVAILTTIGIVASLVFETVRFFGMVSPIDFLFGTQWNPDPMSNPLNPQGDRYGAIPLFWGTIFIGAIIAMIVAIPLGLMSAIYLTQYADPRVRAWVKPALEVLAGVPTAVSYTHLRAHETRGNLVCRLLLEKKKVERIEERSLRSEQSKTPPLRWVGGLLELINE